MKKICFEKKINGINIYLVSAFLVTLIVFLTYICGDLVNVSCVVFEVIFPFYTSVAIGEWGKIKSDMNFSIIASQAESLFLWILCRFCTIYLTVGLFSAAGIALVCILRAEMAWHEMLFIYFATSFFLSSLSMLCSFLFVQEHMAVLICGILWLLTMLTPSLLRYRYVEYIYLFIRYAGDQNNVWLINKSLLMGMGILMWGLICFLCRKRKFCEAV